MARRSIFLAIVAAATVAIVVPITVFGLPAGKSDPESFAHVYTFPDNGNQTHLHIDADATNGTRPCDPIDSEATVKVGDAHQVAVCIETYEPNSIESFELHIHYTGDPDATPPTTINTAPTLEGEAPMLDLNPDANDGDDPTGFKLGDGWDCSAWGLAPPVGDDPLTPNVADARIICFADLAAPDRDLSADPGLLATITFNAVAVGDDIIDFGPIGSKNMNTVGLPRPGSGFARCGTGVPADQVACFGATINKVVFDCVFEDDFDRGTYLGLLGNDWEFGFPGGTLSGTGRVMRFGDHAFVFGRGQGFYVAGFGTCPLGPGRAFGLDFTSFPPRFLRVQDVTGGVD
jgi:hypothetical protein